MKKVFFSFCMVLFLSICASGQNTLTQDDRIRSYANELNVPYDAFKQFVESYQVQNIPSGTIEITALQLYDAFTENHVRGDIMYKNKIVKITGKILGVFKDTWNDSYFIAFEMKPHTYHYSVKCFFVSSELNKVANLKEGQTITAIGKCEGFDGFSVIMKDATIQILN